MRIVFLLLFLLFEITLISAQNIQLEWQSVKKVETIENRTKRLPSFQSNNFQINLDGIPLYSKTTPTDSYQKIELTNIETSIVSKPDLGQIPIDLIPESFNYTANVSKSKNKYFENISFVPFYKSGNNIHRIESFQIQRIDSPEPEVLSFTSSPSVFREENGTFYKIAIDTTGIYKLDFNFFRTHGIPTNFNTKKLKLYGNGGMMLPANPREFVYDGIQENAILMVDGDDGSFDSGDYILFYGQGPNGIGKNPFKGSESIVHSKNIYEDKAYYFINLDSFAFGKRIIDQQEQSNPTEVFTDFDQILFHEKDSVNINNVGRKWFGEFFGIKNQYNFNFNAAGTITSDIEVSLSGVGINSLYNNLSISINGQSTGILNFTSTNRPDFDLKTSNSITSATYPLNIQLDFDNSSNPTGGAYLDYFRLKFKQSLNFGDNQLGFRWFDGIENQNSYGFIIQGNPEYVWNVTNRVSARNMLDVNGTYLFNTNDERFNNEFIAFNSNQAYNPSYVGTIASQNIKSLSNIDYIVITHPSFLTEARKMARNRQEAFGLNSTVVTTEQIYNQYSSGGQDLTAIRNFLKQLYNQPNPVKYVLLFGDGSYDFKDRITNNTNFVPAYQSESSYNLSASFVTDDYIVMLDDTDNPYLDNSNVSSQIDVAIGRFSASNLQEAKTMVNKTLAYTNDLTEQANPFGNWRTKVHFVVDDDNPGPNQAFHLNINNNSADYLRDEVPYLTIRKLYIDAFEQVSSAGGDRYPSVNEAIFNAVETGSLFMNYFGHGGLNGWAQERILVNSEINEMSNFNTESAKLPVFMTVTCDFSVWDIPEIESGGELLHKNPRGGAVALLTTSREIGVVYGKQFNPILVKRLFETQNNSFTPIGEALLLAKQDYGNNTNSYSVNLLGDPFLSIARPKRNITINSINNEPADSFNTQIQAMDFVTIEGSINDLNSNSIDEDFNGQLAATLFDKPIERRTLNNDGDLTVLNYTEQVQALFRGKTEVENGKFKLEFNVPSEINFEVGNGKLLLYGYNDETDAVQSKQDIKIGGVNPNGFDDNEGPSIGLYMNNTNFANGGITDRNPYLLACLTDSIGVNATGIGIGHDITFLLDNEISSTTILNDYYDGGENSPCRNPNVKDYQKGKVFYKLRNLDLGEHTVTLKAWDINNNSNTETLSFIVMNDGEQQLHINKLLNWPNPFTDQTYIHFEHNCPEALQVQVQIFTVSGKLVKTIRQKVSSKPFREGYRTGKFDIPWNGLDDFGNKIGKGVYIYKTQVKGDNPDVCKGVATETEKLVILK